MRRSAISLRVLTALGLVLAASHAGAAQLPGDGAGPEALQPATGRGELRQGAPLAALAATVYEFPSSLSTVVASIGFIDEFDIGYFWWAARGDGVSETFVGPPAIIGLQLDVDVRNNLLQPGLRVEWDVRVNGTTVDHFDVPAGFIGTVSRAVEFARIPGPTYAVELRVTNEVPRSMGAHTLSYAGSNPHQLALLQGLSVQATGTCPEPLSLVVDGATPGAEVLLLWSQRTGSGVLRVDPCAGTTLGLARPHRLASSTAGATGGFTIEIRPPGGACGAFLEAVDLATCTASGAVPIP